MVVFQKEIKMVSKAGKFKDVYQELINLPKNMVGEIINDQLYAQPRPDPRHALVSSCLGDELVGPYYKGRGGPGGWWILFEPEIHLDNEILVPDIAGWKKERLPKLPETAFFEIPPDWVCEILSHSTLKKDRVLKMPLYAKFNFQYIWLIDPLAKMLEVYQLEKKYWKLIGTFAENDKVSAVPFQEVTIDLSVLWE